MNQPANSTEESSPEQELLQESSIYRNFVKQQEEVLRHKWFMSEKVGHDVGFETALLDWMINHRQNWLKSGSLGAR